MVKTSKSDPIFQLKISLNNSAPRVWRRILIPAESTFFELHVAIQNSVGWGDGHLHGFYIAQKGAARSIMIQFPDSENNDFFGDEARDERREKLSDYLGASIKQCKYTYDFGDSWDHTILLEREVARRTGQSYPQCLAGANACPPEDCGGVWGYRDLQKIIGDPKHPEHQEMLEWLCIDDSSEFDSTEFSVKDVIFDNARHRLKEYEKGFGVAPL